MMERLPAGDSLLWRKELQATWKEWELANRLSREAKKELEGGDVGAQSRIQKAAEMAQAALLKLKSLIEGGGKRDDAWQDLIASTYEAVSLKKSEAGRLKDLHQMMSADEVVAIMTSLQLAIAEVVKDPKVRTAIGVKMAQLLNFRTGAGQGPVGWPGPAGPGQPAMIVDVPS